MLTVIYMLSKIYFVKFIPICQTDQISANTVDVHLYVKLKCADV